MLDRIDDEASFLLATFQVRDSHYGLDTNCVQEVILVGESTRVHSAPETVRGIINLRGKIVTVIDLGRKLYDEDTFLSEESRILVVSWMGEQVGLLVDSVTDVLSLDEQQIKSTPLNVNDIQNRYLKGVFHDQGRLVAILDLDAVLAE